MIRLWTYDDDLDELPRRSVFLAGPTTRRGRCCDRHGVDCADVPCCPRCRMDDSRDVGMFGDVALSRWRADFCEHLAAMLAARGDLEDVHVVVPEFTAAGEFADLAQRRWGATRVPEAVPCCPQSWGVLTWEKRGLAEANTVVVAWHDCRDEQPGLGLNMRPEIQGLLERRGAGAAWPQYVVLGISRDATAAARFWALAKEVGLPVFRSPRELAQRAYFALRYYAHRSAPAEVGLLRCRAAGSHAEVVVGPLLELTCPTCWAGADLVSAADLAAEVGPGGADASSADARARRREDYLRVADAVLAASGMEDASASDLWRHVGGAVVGGPCEVAAARGILRWALEVVADRSPPAAP